MLRSDGAGTKFSFTFRNQFRKIRNGNGTSSTFKNSERNGNGTAIFQRFLVPFRNDFFPFFTQFLVKKAAYIITKLYTQNYYTVSLQNKSLLSYHHNIIRPYLQSMQYVFHKTQGKFFKNSRRIPKKSRKFNVMKQKNEMCINISTKLHYRKYHLRFCEWL